VTTLRLVDGAEEFVLYPRDDAELQALDLGFPDVREVVDDAVDDDGTEDSTERIGARVVAVELVLFDQPLTLLDQIRRYAHPSRRSYLVISEDEWAEDRRILVRTAQQAVTRSPGLPALVVQLQWKAPDGILEAVDAELRTVGPEGGAEVTGITFPTSAPFAFPASINEQAGTLEVAGTVPVHWKARLWGPCSSPAISNDTTGETLTFPGLALPAGGYLEVDSRARSALENGDPGASRLGQLNFAASRWWRLLPGVNQLRYHPGSIGPGAHADVEWRQAWL